MIKFNIVLPIYNSPDVVLRSVCSVSNQNYENYHIYISNDGALSSYCDLEIYIKDKNDITYIKLKKILELIKFWN